MGIAAVGHDVVDVEAFAEQLAMPGSRIKGLFSVRELRQATARAQAKHDGEAVHLAAKWAGKEAVLKAWEQALGDNPSPYTLDNFPWRGIEILDDDRGRPQVMLAADVARTLRDSLPPVRSERSPRSLPMPVPGAMAGASAAIRRPGFSSAPSDYVQTPHVFRISLSHDGPVASAVVILE
ncbi:holo-ACP synthase [Bifidobacterium oedipodis]|uniref:4-phosphopantetheinyl transferase n=1 Tax=Bifidobacterium oedipodis TaxID=2675322 RepID=A0A7Y0ERC0_9BIFI|nr:4'-phosphopantetheinyl transferase superfamily protein [Bifidobacterium sp. DSM 109957]NMM95016.1 4-phosphopantetheinyl transferase [Bifidobacterium sp. DSM 109957]